MSARCPNCGKPVPPSALQGLCPECMLALGAASQTDTGGGTGPHGTKAAPSPPAKPEEIGKHFPQLEILECLGRGGMGVVYKARQPRLDRLVALKILAPEKEQDPKFAERFAREAKALARLNHPNIVTVYDFGEADGMFYLLMEYVDGVTLRQLLQTGKIVPEEALSIVPKICDALQFAHDLGVVHRDIKPENVLLDQQGRVKIADFGIAKIMGAEGRAGSPLPADATPPEGGAQGTARPALPFTQDQVVGTPHYMAPEQVEHPQRVDHRADIYSLGVVFYEMLTGELPLGKFAPPSKRVHVDVRLDEIVLHALEKEPERRYQQASEVKTAVETIAGAPQTPSAAMNDKSLAVVQRLLNVPSIGLMVVGGINLLIFLLGVFGLLAAITFGEVQARLGLIPCLLFLFASGLVVLGAVQMGRLRNYGMAVTASILAIITLSPILPLGVFHGLFALLRLTRPGVREAFAASKTAMQTIAATAAPRPPSARESADLENARGQVKVPAVGLIVLSGLSLLVFAVWFPIWIIGASASIAGKTSGLPWTLVIPIGLVMTGCNFVSFVGAWRMRQLRSYRLAVVGSILFMLSPCLGLQSAIICKVSHPFWSNMPYVLLGLLFGIWSLIVLSRRQVQEAFGQAPLLPTPQSAQRKRVGLAWIVAALVCGIGLGTFAIVQVALRYKRRDVTALLNTIGSASSAGGTVGAAESLGPVPGASLTSAQIEAYLAQNKRNAESLLAAYRMSGNVTYLKEAASKFPGDRDVQYAVIAAKAFPAAQRQWIDAYKASAPDNALAWYFSALDYFRAGQTNLAVQELAEATRKPAFRAELAPMLQGVEELNLSAGRTADGAKMVALAACAFVPHLTLMRDLASAMEATAQQYRQHGDSAAAESLAGMGLVLGHHLEAGGGSQMVINQLVGVAIEKRFVPLMDPNSRDPLGRRVGEVSAAIAQHAKTLKSYARMISRLQPRLLTTAEGATYLERVKLYGEEAALAGLKAKYEGQETQPDMQETLKAAEQEGRSNRIAQPAKEPAAATRPTVESGAPELNREVIRIRLRQAEAEVARLEELFRDEAVTESQLQEAKDKVELLKADLDGDPVRSARAKLAAAERTLKRASNLFTVQDLSASDYEAAKAEVEVAKAELQAALSGQSRAPNQPEVGLAKALSQQVPPVATLHQAAATLKRFTAADRPISREFALTEDGWAVSCTTTQTFRLFELPNPGVEHCTLIYLATLKTEGLVGRAYLEMWCRFPGRGEFFSRGLDNAVTGPNDATGQTWFFLKAGEKPDLIRLNLVVEGRGKVLINHIMLAKAPSG